jgi:hypothetical protein
VKRAHSRFMLELTCWSFFFPLFKFKFKGWFVLFQPLDDAVLSELKTVLKSFLSQGQVLKLEVKVGFNYL